jgi:hypothetical protein
MYTFFCCLYHFLQISRSSPCLRWVLATVFCVLFWHAEIRGDSQERPLHYLNIWIPARADQPRSGLSIGSARSSACRVPAVVHSSGIWRATINGSRMRTDSPIISEHAIVAFRRTYLSVMSSNYYYLMTYNFSKRKWKSIPSLRQWPTQIWCTLAK